ncbi:unknown [Collinsella sp. CAG:398]|nr:unknown [Collinsella sp. CAG:398]
MGDGRGCRRGLAIFGDGNVADLEGRFVEPRGICLVIRIAISAKTGKDAIGLGKQAIALACLGILIEAQMFLKIRGDDFFRAR